jgi:hypothetical protein
VSFEVPKAPDTTDRQTRTNSIVPPPSSPRTGAQSGGGGGGGTIELLWDCRAVLSGAIGTSKTTGKQYTSKSRSVPRRLVVPVRNGVLHSR